MIKPRLAVPASVLLDDRIHRNEQNYRFWSDVLKDALAHRDRRRAERRRNRNVPDRDAAVLAAIEAGYTYGLEISDAAGLRSGTVYPSLLRLEQAGLIESEWEWQQASDGNFRRRVYRRAGR